MVFQNLDKEINNVNYLKKITQEKLLPYNNDNNINNLNNKKQLVLTI